LNLAGITSTDAHLERNFRITGVSADGTAFTDVNVEPAVEGHFSFVTTIVGSGADAVSGKVDYLAGTVTVSSTTGVVTEIKFEVTCSLEETSRFKKFLKQEISSHKYLYLEKNFIIVVGGQRIAK
jgi:hypothetical protein